MTKEELIEKLKALHDNDDTEHVHYVADTLLIEYINDIEITEAYHKIDKWYA